MRFSINFPTIICLPTVCYFSREKPLVKPTALESSFSYICLAIYFSFVFLFRSIKPKIQKYLAALYLFAIYYSNLLQFSPVNLPSGTVTRKGLTTPLTHRVASGCLHFVVWFSYWFDTLVSLLREIPTVAVLHHPLLLGETPT